MYIHMYSYNSSHICACMCVCACMWVYKGHFENEPCRTPYVPSRSQTHTHTHVHTHKHTRCYLPSTHAMKMEPMRPLTPAKV